MEPGLGFHVWHKGSLQQWHLQVVARLQLALTTPIQDLLNMHLPSRLPPTKCGCTHVCIHAPLQMLLTGLNTDTALP